MFSALAPFFIRDRPLNCAGGWAAMLTAAQSLDRAIYEVVQTDNEFTIVPKAAANMFLGYRLIGHRNRESPVLLESLRHGQFSLFYAAIGVCSALIILALLARMALLPTRWEEAAEVAIFLAMYVAAFLAFPELVLWQARLKFFRLRRIFSGLGANSSPHRQ